MNRREFFQVATAAPGLSLLGGLTADAGRPKGGTPAVGQASALRRQDFTFYSPLSREWYEGGEYFSWTSTTPNNEGRAVRVFYRTFGDRSNPAVVLLHGFPTSSFDFRELIGLLESDYFLCVLDFPGFGFSDKPQDGYSYMLADDARLVDHFVREVVGLSRFHLLTHDRGVSVGLALLGNYLDAPRRDYEITYHLLSNSGVFLPLANLIQTQIDILDPVRGPAMIEGAKSAPRVTEGPPEEVAYADIQAFNDGIGVLLYVGKYLLERAANEYRWLANLQESPIPTALYWGILDNVNPVRIADHVWMTYLNDREVESSFWLLPTAGHYPQRDAPEGVEAVVRACLTGRVPPVEREGAFMRVIASERDTAASPVYVGHSRIREVRFPGAVQYSPAGYGD